MVKVKIDDMTATYDKGKWTCDSAAMQGLLTTCSDKARGYLPEAVNADAILHEALDGTGIRWEITLIDSEPYDPNVIY